MDETVKESHFKTVKIEGCNYQVTEDEIIQWLQHFGRLMGPIQEGTFEDKNNDGAENGNGNYVVKMRIVKEMPELIPMCGQKVKIYYQGIKKMCKNCLLYHKESCRKERAPWSTYVRLFKENHPDVPAGLIDRHEINQDQVTAGDCCDVDELNVEEKMNMNENKQDNNDQENAPGNTDTDEQETDNESVEDDPSSGEDEEEQESETEEEFERRKEAAFEEASVEHAKKMYEDLLKSCGKRWADKMKSELKNIARSKIEAEIEKRHSLVPKK
jgi:hypothetical protein